MLEIGAQATLSLSQTSILLFMQDFLALRKKEQALGWT